MITNQAIASGLTFLTNHFLKFCHDNVCHSLEAKLSVAPESLANKEDSLIWQSRLNTV